jgi:hypothetical protein
LTGQVGDSGGNNQALEEQHIPGTVARPTSYYDFWNPKFEDFFSESEKTSRGGFCQRANR